MSSTASALTIDEAKKQGRVGETLSGYLAAVKQDSETLAFVEKINSGRTEKYKEIAIKNNTKVDDVARMTGEKLVARAVEGEYVRGINGMWVKK